MSPRITEVPSPVRSAGLVIGCFAAALVVAGCGAGRSHFTRPAGMIGPAEGFGATGAEGATGKFGPTGNIGGYDDWSIPYYPRIRPVLMSPAELKAEARSIRQRIYWAGPKPGFSYEFTRTKTGNVYVRYLPRGVRAGAPGARYSIVATYFFINAYGALRDGTGRKAVSGPGGTLVYARRANPKSALIAFRGNCPTKRWVFDCGGDYEVEVYDPDEAVSAKVAVESGQVRVKPVG